MIRVAWLVVGFSQKYGKVAGVAAVAAAASACPLDSALSSGLEYSRETKEGEGGRAGRIRLAAGLESDSTPAT